MNPINSALRRPRTAILLLLMVMAGISVIRPPTVDQWLRKRGVELALKRIAVKLLLSSMKSRDTYAV